MFRTRLLRHVVKNSFQMCPAVAAYSVINNKRGDLDNRIIRVECRNMLPMFTSHCWDFLRQPKHAKRLGWVFYVPAEATAVLFSASSLTFFLCQHDNS